MTHDKRIVQVVIIFTFLINLYCIYIPGSNLSKEKPYMPDYMILRHNGKRVFVPQTLAPKYPVVNIFAVPVKNALGTIDIDNAITIMRFTDNDIEYDIVAKNFLKHVNGAYKFGFCNVYSDEEIAYTQSRWAVIANIKTGKVVTPVITYNLDDLITGLRPLGNRGEGKYLLLREGPYYGKGSEDFLHLVRLINNDSIQDEGFLNAGISTIGYKIPWQLHNDLIFTYDVDSNRIPCHDSNLKPFQHPFADVFNNNSRNWRRIKEFIIHPTLPLGLIVEKGKKVDWDSIHSLPNEVYEEARKPVIKERDRHVLYLLRWDISDPEKQIIPILTDSLSLIPPVTCKSYSGFQFSPDGSWLVFKDETNDMLKPVFIALPVIKDSPLFLGEPLYLGRLMTKDATPRMSAWTTDPLGFTISSGEHGLWKWDLGRVDKAKVVDMAEGIIQTE